MNNGTGFKLLLGISADGFLAKGPDDDMKWTGPDDKGIFRVLTLAGGTVLAGRRTAELLPPLPGRKVVTISRQHHLGLTLQEASWAHRSAWLIGGPETALAALRAGMVEQAFIVRSPNSIGGGIPFSTLDRLLGVTTYTQKIGEATVYIYDELH